MTRLRHESEPRFWSKITKPLKQFQSFLSTHRRGGRATMAFNVPALVGSFAAQTVVVFASCAAPKFTLGGAVDAGLRLLDGDLRTGPTPSSSAA